MKTGREQDTNQERIPMKTNDSTVRDMWVVRVSITRKDKGKKNENREKVRGEERGKRRQKERTERGENRRVDKTT